jgi:peptidylprolyl isomerase
MTAKNGDRVKVHYTGKFEDGEVFDSSLENSPLEFVIGSGSIIKGFENAVIGMDIGDSKIENIQAEDAYGLYNDDLLMILNKEEIPPNINPQVGEELELHGKNGESFPVMVTDVNDSTITLDANHPLAGENLIFEINLIDIG